MENPEIIVGSYDKYKDFELDPKGYFLIKVYSDENKLGIRFCDNTSHEPIIDIFGKTPQDCYYTAVEKGLISRLDHAAYLGKELMKAFVCMKEGKPYEQDSDEL
jgi:tetrahydromethanopterin S-methyltransferase subunit A